MQLSVNVRKMQQKMKNIWIVEFYEEVGIPKTQKIDNLKLRLKSKLILLILKGNNKCTTSNIALKG